MAGVQKFEEVRDLREKAAGLVSPKDPEIIFRSTSPGRTPVTLYNTESGEPITIPEYMVAQAIVRRREDGEFRFTTDKSKAPEYKLGTTLCFLHADSAERPMLNEIGLASIVCRKSTLSNDYSKRQHARHRHQAEWGAYQEHLEAVSAASEREERRQQLEATLAIARAAQANGQAEYDCPDCDWEPKAGAKSPATSLGMHTKAAHPSLE